MLKFSVQACDSGTRARTGILELAHGTFRTPQFMPVGTNGTVKAITHAALAEMGVPILLGNTYHLYLRPGVDVIRAAGGLHAFSGWGANILTDSGGFQVFSLAPFRKITEEGVEFRSHFDGSTHFLTPESVVDVQRALGSDIMMALDVCTSPGIDYRDAAAATDTTTRWARRAARRFRETSGEGELFGIVQGNFYEDLRRRSAGEVGELGLSGIAIGGLSVGEPLATFKEFLELTSGLLPTTIPRYLMGIGTPEFIFAAVENGIDLFDCVYPTRIGRHGAVFTRQGVMNLKREEHRRSFVPIDEGCACPVCRTYTRAYLRHLFNAGEMLGPMLATHHNLYFLQMLLSELRASIEGGNFAAFRDSFLAAYSSKGRVRA